MLLNEKTEPKDATVDDFMETVYFYQENAPTEAIDKTH